MHGKLIVAIPALTGVQRAAIRAAAEGRGIGVEFYESEADALPAAAEAEILFSTSAELARRAPKLRWQCTPSAGVNQFTAPGVFASPDAQLTNSSGAYGVTLAEHAVMLALMALRRQKDYIGIVARRAWENQIPVGSIYGCRAALLGTGDIGMNVARRLRPFEPASIVGVNRGGRNPENLFDGIVTLDRLDELLPETDLVVMSLPGTDETRHILNAERLALLPDGAVIVNVGRGSSVDETALEKELRAGRLFAALDVFETEPLPPDSTLWDCPNLLITPHSAGNLTLPHTLERIVEMFLADLERYCAGQPLQQRVDIARGY